jgi:gliding motility-associated-like protein
MNRFIPIFIFLAFSILKAGNPPSIIFKENKGQWPEKVLFGTEFYNVKFYANKTSFNYCIYNPNDLGGKGHQSENKKVIHGHNYEVNFVNADLTNVTRSNIQPEYYNYFLGNNRSNWASKVKAFGGLTFNSIYDSIDLKLYSNGSNLKYDFIVKRGGDVNSIRMNYDHVDGIELVNNEIIIKTSVGNIIEMEPFAYQMINGKQAKVKCEYTLLEDNSIGFIFPDGYNKEHELIIDPVVVACSYSGSSVEAYNVSSSYDKNGNIYTYGGAEIGYPTSLGAFQISSNGAFDNFVSAYNSNGSAKLFSTFIGGDSTDWPIEILVKNNEIILFGYSDSPNYPFTKTAFDTIINGKTDFVISKLNISGTSLLASTCFGGAKNEPMGGFPSSWQILTPGEIVADTSGNVYILSATESADFPVTPGAFSTTKSGPNDACVFKMDKALSNLIWSTYLGGSNSDDGRSLKLDGAGGVYCFGSTNSNNFPTTPGTAVPSKIGVGGNMDFFITHLNSTGSALIASTYVGTIGNDRAELMDVGQNNDVYISGYFSSTSQLTVTPGYYSGGGINCIYKLNSSLSNIIFKIKYGTTQSGAYPNLALSAFKVDSCHNVYIAGFAYNTLPVTPDQFKPFAGGYTDLYMAVFANDCSSLKFGSFYGGNSPPPTGYTLVDEQIGGICQFDSKGILYLSVNSSGNLPTTSNAWAPISANSSSLASIYNDAFLKVDLGTFVNAGSSYGANIIGCPPFTPTFVSITNLGTTYWNLGNGITSTKDTISTTYTDLGTYNVLLIVTDTTTCNKYDSIKSILNVINPTNFDLGDDLKTCFDTKILINSNVTAVTYSWSNGQTTPNISVLPGTYTLTINNGGCNSSDAINVVVGEAPLSERFPNVITANGDNVNDFIDLKKYNFEEIELFIFDRWGREVIKITDPRTEWHPDNLNAGTYYYVAKYLSSCIGKYGTDKGYISIFK